MALGKTSEIVTTLTVRKAIAIINSNSVAPRAFILGAGEGIVVRRRRRRHLAGRDRSGFGEGASRRCRGAPAREFVRPMGDVQDGDTILPSNR